MCNENQNSIFNVNMIHPICVWGAHKFEHARFRHGIKKKPQKRIQSQLLSVVSCCCYVRIPITLDADSRRPPDTTESIAVEIRPSAIHLLICLSSLLLLLFCSFCVVLPSPVFLFPSERRWYDSECQVKWGLTCSGRTRPLYVSVLEFIFSDFGFASSIFFFFFFWCF
jgi:hypothetical protein